MKEKKNIISTSFLPYNNLTFKVAGNRKQETAMIWTVINPIKPFNKCNKCNIYYSLFIHSIHFHPLFILFHCEKSLNETPKDKTKNNSH